MKKITLIIGLVLVGTSYNHAQEISDLVAKYSFNGGNANDEVGTVHGTVLGATLTTDRFGNPNMAYAFNSADSTQIVIPNASSNTYTNTDPFAFAFWVKFDTLNPSNTLVAGKGVIDGTWNGYSFYSNNQDLGYCNGQGTLFFYTASAGMEDACADNLVANNFSDWQFVVGNYSGGTELSTLFINGVEQADIGTISGTLAANSNLYLGGYPANPYTHFFTGSIDDIRIFNRALTQQEITQLFNESNPVLSLGTVAHSTITLAPNPANEQLTITSETPTTVSVLTVLGEQLISLEIYGTTTLDISTFTPGVYLITTPTGENQHFIKY